MVSAACHTILHKRLVRDQPVSMVAASCTICSAASNCRQRLGAGSATHSMHSCMLHMEDQHLCTHRCNGETDDVLQSLEDL